MPALHDHRRPFTFETIVHALDRLFSPVPVLLAAVFLVKPWKSGLVLELSNVHQKHPALLASAALVALKYINRAATRLTLNNGWTRSRPQWEKEIVVVTGGAAGIGKEVVEMLIRGFPGVRVAVLDIAEPTDRPKTIAVRYWKVNVIDADQVHRAAEEIRSELGEPTMIVSNAGIVRAKALLELSAKEFDTTMKVNLLGTFIITKEFLPAMVARNRGHIVAVASAAAFLYPPGMPDYCASKSALLAFHEVLTAELRDRYDASRVRTTCLIPAKVDTSLGTMVNDLAGSAITPTLQAWEVAERIVQTLDSGLSGGTVFVPSFLWLGLPPLRTLPPYVYRFVAWSLGLNSFATTEGRQRGIKSGYKIHADEQ